MTPNAEVGTKLSGGETKARRMLAEDETYFIDILS